MGRKTQNCYFWYNLIIVVFHDLQNGYYFLNKLSRNNDLRLSATQKANKPEKQKQTNKQKQKQKQNTQKKTQTKQIKNTSKTKQNKTKITLVRSREFPNSNEFSSNKYNSNLNLRMGVHIKQGRKVLKLSTTFPALLTSIR